jgi:cytoskeletal protein RodZ
MDSLGERLKKGREEKGISLEEVSKATKISKSVLKDLENDHHDALPPPVFIRGFIRSYSRYVGLNEKELLNLWEEIIAKKRTDESQRKEKSKKDFDRKKLILLLILFSILGFLLVYNLTAKKSFVVETPSESKKTVVPEISKTKEKTILNKTSQPLTYIPIKLGVNCISRTWIEVTIDNEPPFEVTLFPGEEVSWEGEKRIELKIGNAGGIKITVNGIPLKSFGKTKEVVRLIFEGNTVSINGGKPQEIKLWKKKKS